MSRRDQNDAREAALIRAASDADVLLDEGLGAGGDGAPAEDWDDLLRRNGIEAPRSRFELEPADHAAYTLAGVIGGVLDLTATIEGALTNEGVHERFDALAKGHIERVTGQAGAPAIDHIRGGGGHRLFGPGHDLARLAETVSQVMRGEYRAVVKGVEHVARGHSSRSRPYVPVESPGDALVVVLLHLFGDFFSSMSLPMPGRSVLAEVDDVELVRRVVSEYHAGGSLRRQVASFLDSFSGAVFVSLALRLYRYVAIVAEKGVSALSPSALRLRNDVRYHVLHRNGQGIAFAVSSGRAVFTGNPLDASWAAFVQHARSATALNRLSRVEQDRLLRRLEAMPVGLEAL